MAAGFCILAFHVSPATAESGYQTINGTRVFTVIDHASRTATFSNECGSQTLTQSQLQGGAIPDQIIPCPRPAASARAPIAVRPAPMQPTPSERALDVPDDADVTGAAYDRALAQESRCNLLAQQSKYDAAAKCYIATARLYARTGHARDDQQRMKSLGEKMQAAARAPGSAAGRANPGHAANQRGPLPEGCVVLGAPRLVNSMCDFKPGHMLYYTPVKTSTAVGCPEEIIVEYIDPETKKLQTWVANRRGTNIETCTAGVTAARPRGRQ
jgi:hypothetical protein